MTKMKHGGVVALASLSGGGTGFYGGNGGGGESGGGGGGGGDMGGGPMQQSDGQALPRDEQSSQPPASNMVEEVILLDVSGMKCGGCVGHVKKILESQPGVLKANVNLATETTLVHVMVRSSSKKDKTDGSKEEKVEDIGERLASALTRAGFKTTPREGGGVRGSSNTSTVLQSKRAEKQARLKEIDGNLVLAWGLSALSSLGHIAHAFISSSSGSTLIPAWVQILHSPPLQAALSVVALLGPGREILSQGFSSLVQNRPDMNTLVGLGATASFGVSCISAALPHLGWKTHFGEPAMLLGFVLIGRALEERAKLQASSDITALQDLVPTKARLALVKGGFKEVPVEAVGPGDLVVVLPGDKIPVDGVVVEGRSSIDESALTGEALPVIKTQGSSVTAGTMNCDGTVTVRAEQSGQGTVIADIVRMVEMAQARTAPIQRMADSVAGKFAYGIMGLSVATFAFWALFGVRAFPQALVAASGGSSAAAACAACIKAGASAASGSVAASSTLASTLILSAQMACNVLVTACPCALGLATPTAVLVGTAAGARRGLLIRGGDILEETAGVDVVVFDKTGTLTSGRPIVTAVNRGLESDREGQKGGIDADMILRLAAAVEANTTHPVAQAIVRASSDSKSNSNNLPRLAQSTFVQEPGSGASAVIEKGGQRVSVGTIEWLARQGAVSTRPISDPSTPLSSSSQSSSDSQDSDLGMEMGSSRTRVYVGVGSEVVGSIDVADSLRPDARESVHALSLMGIRSILLSGDKEGAAREVARAVGIADSDVYSEVKPAGKAALVEELRAQGRRVVMCGDGVNDTAALAASNVGMAMGGGVDAASEVANIVLLGNNVSQVVDAVRLSRKTLDKIKQNLTWAFGYNLVAVPLAAGALMPSLGLCLTPSISGALMGLSSVIVCSNSLLLQFEIGHDLDKGKGKRLPLSTLPSSSDEKGSSKGGLRQLTAATLAATLPSLR